MSDTMNTTTTSSPEADLAHLATQIRAAHDAVSTAATQADALEYAREAGRLLAEAKGLCGHGEWLPWLAANCPDIGARQVQKYMKLAANWDAIARRMPRDSHLSIEGALRLLSDDPAEILPADGEDELADSQDEDEQTADGDEAELEADEESGEEPEYESAEADGGEDTESEEEPDGEVTWADFGEWLAAVTGFARGVGGGPLPPLEDRADLVKVMEGTARTLLGAAGRLRHAV